MKSKLTTSDWLKALSDANSVKADKIPNGWKSVPEIGEDIGMSSHGAVLGFLRRLVAMNKAEVRTFRILDARGRIKHAKHYRLL